MGKKSLDDDDVSIWKKVTETVNPILRRRFGKAEFEATEILEPKTKPSPKKKTAQNATPAEQKPAAPEQKLPSPKKNQTLTPANLDQTGFGGISRAGARAIKSGQSGYTRRIDLHGLSREQAQIKLRQFLQSSSQMGHRHVLVITGKGTAGKGVIRTYFPIWLNEPPLSNLVIAYCQAQPKDGGGGAWYVNLRT